MPHTMCSTKAEVIHFFNVEIGIPEKTMMHLGEEGFERSENLGEFNPENAKGIAEAFRKHAGMPSSGNAKASIIPAPGERIGARALIRLEAVME